MNELANKITFLRKKAGLNVRQLAKKLNVSAQTVHHWESGRNNPSTSNLKLLSDMFRFEFVELEINEELLSEIESESNTLDYLSLKKRITILESEIFQIHARLKAFESHRNI